MKKIYLIFTLFFCIYSQVLKAQTPSWLNTIGNNGYDITTHLETDNAGNFYICGRFNSTVDFDPGPSVFNLSSNGQDDGFLAKYTPSGQFLWAFNIGSSDLDGATGLKINTANEVLVTGYFRGANVDFDPSAANYLMNAPGQAGSNVGFGGDIYLAKYTTNGQFIWAFPIVGEYSHDKPEDIEVDENDNIYLVGAVNGTSGFAIDADPGPGIYDLAGKGHAFVAKYTTNGSFLWAFNYGGVGLNSGSQTIVYDQINSAIVISGFFSGTNVDFDPGPGTFNLSSNGVEDGLIAKYSIAGNFIWALKYGSSNIDYVTDLGLDNNSNVYVCGIFTGSNVDFNPSAAVNNLSSNGGIDIAIMKYSSAGNYIWAKSFGGGGNDFVECLSRINNTIYYTGSYTSTVDFDPSVANFNQVSNGLGDVYISKFDTAGNFICASSIGGPQDELGYNINRISTDSFYLSGAFSSNNMDFDPGASNLLKPNIGDYDIFFGKYSLINIPSNISSTIIGDTICNNQIPTITISLNPAYNLPFDIQLNDGSSIITIPNVTNNIPFQIVPSPTVTTTYTLTATIIVNNTCSSDTINISGTTTIVVLPSSNISCTANPPVVCSGEQIILNASGGVIYSWSGGITNGIPFIPVSSTIYIVTGTDANGCTNTSSINITVNPLPNVFGIASPSTVCLGNPTNLTGTGASSYQWSGGVVNGVSFIPSSTSIYSVIGTDANGCSNSNTVQVNVITSIPISVSPSQSILCLGDSVELVASGGTIYSWAPNIGLNTNGVPAVWAKPSTNTIYTVTGRDASGCSGTATAEVQIITTPEITLSKSNDIICDVKTIQLRAHGADNYEWSPTNLLSNPSDAITNATIEETTTFTVTATIGSCKVVDSITVYYYNNTETGIFIPTAFSPNNDGVNDCFEIKTKGLYLKYELYIFNRWGMPVFESINPMECWDGFYRNEQAPIGSYYYFLKAKTNCGDLFKKGDITLIR